MIFSLSDNVRYASYHNVEEKNLTDNKLECYTKHLVHILYFHSFIDIAVLQRFKGYIEQNRKVCSIDFISND